MSEAKEPSAKPLRRFFAGGFWFLIWLLALVGIGVLVNQSETFTNCVHTHKTDKQYQKLHERFGILGGALEREVIRVRLLTSCAGTFADKNNGGIVAFATLLVGFFTFTLWQSTRRLWLSSERHAINMEASLGVSREQHGLIRQQFFATHSPRLVIRYLHIIEEGAGGDHEAQLGFSIENVGASEAEITQSVVGLLMLQAPLPLPPPFHHLRQNMMGNPKIPPGGIEFFRVSTAGVTNNDRRTIGGRSLHALGWIEYKDAIGNKRTLRFCRRYLAGYRRFEKANDPEYEPEE